MPTNVPNTVSISDSIVQIKAVDNKHRVLTYDTFQYRASSQKWEDRTGRHELPVSSPIDANWFKEGQRYLLTSARLPSEHSYSGRWHLISATHIESGEKVFDHSALKYLSRLFFE